MSSQKKREKEHRRLVRAQRKNVKLYANQAKDCEIHSNPYERDNLSDRGRAED